MSWVKLDQRFHWDGAILSLSDAAYRLYVGGLCYCNWHETDGFIERKALRLIAQGMGRLRVNNGLSELSKAGLWTENPDGFDIENYLKYQPSREQLETHRQKMRELGKRGGLASRSSATLSDTVATAVSDPLKPVSSRLVTSSLVSSREMGFKKPEASYDRPDNYVFGADGQPKGLGEP